MIGKIIQIDSSLAVTLPDEVVDQLKLKKGDEIEVSVAPQGEMILMQVAADLRRRRAAVYKGLTN